MSGVDNKKIASEKMHFEILCNKMVFSQKKHSPQKKKNTGERLLGVLVENQGYDTKLCAQPSKHFVKKKTITSKHAISIDIT